VPENPESPRKKYAPPQFRKLNPEQGALFLVGHTWVGDPQARELLELLFPEPGQPAPPSRSR
jgi:hypothetical protein